MTVNLAIAYDGRQEIIDAVRALVSEIGAAEAETNSSWERRIADHLYTRGQRDPDLIIRTSGEQRLSGFMLWQSIWSEIHFCDASWPDFTETHFQAALHSYAQRERRFGG